MAVRGTTLLLLLPLLQSINADWTTTVTTNLVVPNTASAVVDYVTSSTPLPSPFPATFDHALSHTEQLTSVVTVPDGKVPSVRFRPVTSTPNPSTPVVPPTSVSTTTSTGFSVGVSSPSVPSNPSTPGSGSSVPGVSQDTSTSTTSSTTTTFPAMSPSNSVPDVTPSSSTSSTATSSLPLSPGGDVQSTSSGTSSTPINLVSTQSTSSEGSSTLVIPGSTSTMPDLSPSPSGSTGSNPPSSSTAAGTSATSDTASSTSQQSSTDQLTSAGLTSTPDVSSATDSAVGIYAPTESPTSEPWSTVTTITGMPASTDASDNAVLLTNAYNNIDDLKKDPESYKKHINNIKTESEDYLSKTDFDSTKSPCSGLSSKKRALQKRDLLGVFGAVSYIASQAAGATVDTAKSITDMALSCVSPIADEITSEIPDNPGDVTDTITNQVTKGTTYFGEISNIVNDMENKLQDKDNQGSSDSESELSTSSDPSTSTSSTSSTSTCTSSTTFLDCTWSTIVSSTPVSDSSAATWTTSSTESCRTITACPHHALGLHGQCIASRDWVCPLDIVGPFNHLTITIRYSNLHVHGFDICKLNHNDPCPLLPGILLRRPATSQFILPIRLRRLLRHMARRQLHLRRQLLPTVSVLHAAVVLLERVQRRPLHNYKVRRHGLSCDDSAYVNYAVNSDAKSCITSMSSVTVISSIYSSWSASKSSESSASSASSASEASASSASAAAATPTDQIYIVFEDETGELVPYSWKLFHVDMDTGTGTGSDVDINWCDETPLGTSSADDDIKIADVPNPPSIDFEDDAGIDDDDDDDKKASKDCKYDGDSAKLTCPDFEVECETDLDEDMKTKECPGAFHPIEFVPKVWCAWGKGDTNS